MQYEDKVRIATPEGVELELALAGVGSRLTARILDALIQFAVIFVLALASSPSLESSGDATSALLVILALLGGFAIIWIYDIAFEVLGGGRTPGKRAVGLRVVGDHGEPITLGASAVRNLLRLVDEYLTAWIVALVSILRSERNQRVGDMAAGALVVRERTSEAVSSEPITGSNLRDAEEVTTWDATSVTEEELAAARRFLERRSAMEPRARARLAHEIRSRLEPKVPGSDTAAGSERWLELLVVAKSRRG